jgi:hypothetical protein
MPESKTFALSLLSLLGAVAVTTGQEGSRALESREDHWAWRQPVAQRFAQLGKENWVQNPIDVFILARMQTSGLQPAPRALREQLIRRATFDLLGLPPTPAEVDAFVSDPSAGAWEKVIDRLLTSPHYGERWGRHWLDLARFAESNGFEFDEVRPDAWRYRDYVIRAFNADKPFTRFIEEQLAGDELYPNDPDALVATAFNLLGADMTDSSDMLQRRQNTLNDMTDTAGLVFLGMTLACARCHDHKFEPISQADYYRLQAFFAPATFRTDLPIASAEQRRAFDRAQHQYQALIQPLVEKIRKLEEPHRKELLAAKLARLSEEAQAAHRTPEGQRTGGQKELVAETARLVVVTSQEIAGKMSGAERARLRQLQTRIGQFGDGKPAALPVTMGLKERQGVPAKTFVLERGELHSHAAEVQPGFPSILMADHIPVPAAIQYLPTSSGRRTALARWIADSGNPLTARVLVNRLWQHHFGRGIVATPNDFGVRGERPTHPELLDWLALDLINHGYTLKRLHKLMLMSATYQQSTTATGETLEKDRNNLLFSRMNRQRLEAEVIRDSLLAVSGRLNTRLGGPSVSPPLPPQALQGFEGWKTNPDGHDHARRSVYILARRNLRFPFLQVFDLPDTNLSCPRRERSTTAPQALALLNDREVMVAAQELAARIQRQCGSEDQIIAEVYRTTLGRFPSALECQRTRNFLSKSPLSELCRAMFNTNEFVYLD